jgi:hypothetical protein
MRALKKCLLKQEGAKKGVGTKISTPFSYLKVTSADFRCYPNNKKASRAPIVGSMI